MRKALLTLAFLAGVTVASAGEQEIRVPSGAPTVPDSYIVVLEDTAFHSADISGFAVWQMADEMAGRYGGRVTHLYERALRGFAVRMGRAWARALARDPRVKYVEQDSVVWALEAQTNPPWGLDRIDQRDLPRDNSYTYTSTGVGVRAYIIDTGIRTTHADFGGKASPGFTAVSDGNGTNDCNGHGTHVAGTVGGTTYGVAKNVTLVAVRVLNCQGSGTTSGVIAGVNWVTDHFASFNPRVPSVANMSLGGGASQSLDDAVRNSINAGVTYAVAAGNSTANACNYSPARVSQALTVGSSTSTDARSSFSNYGTCVDLFAPGSSITSAWHTSNTATNTISGTSMASPHVAGVAALYLEQNPQLQQNPSTSAAIVADAIVSNATPGKISGAGTGSPNRLLYSLLGGGPPPTDNPPTANFTFSCTGLKCSFDGSGSTDDSGIVSYVWDFGDGQSDSGVKPNDHTYAVAGTYTVTLTVTDNATPSGQTDSQSQPLAVSDASVPCTGCQHYTGSLSGTGASSYQPNGSYYFSSAGVHRGWLRGPSGTDFDLYLQRWNGFGWSIVARSEGWTSEEQIIYNGTSGYYRWWIYSYSGSGNYDFWLIRP